MEFHNKNITKKCIFTMKYCSVLLFGDKKVEVRTEILILRIKSNFCSDKYVNIM